MPNARIFPKPKQEILRTFITQSCLLENIKISQKDMSLTLSKGPDEGNSHVAGHFSAINTILASAHKQDLIPLPFSILSEKNQNIKLNMITTIHKILMEPVAKRGKNIFQNGFEDEETVLCKGKPFPEFYLGTWRKNELKLGPRTMPPPKTVPECMRQWLMSLATLHEKFFDKINNPSFLSNEDLFFLDKEIYNLHIHLLCIKPFEDASNRVARLVYNMIRLNFGLPWRIIKFDDKTKYLKDIWKIQEKYC